VVSPESSDANYVRFGTRVNSRVPVALEWIENGRTSRVEAYTRDISSYGCLLVAPQGFVIGQKVRLINLVNNKQCEARVVRRGQEGSPGWEVGLQLQEPSPEFWEIDL
jgi:PilZ domain